MNIPNDPMILLSYINTKLRDDYASFSLLCEELELDAATIEAKLDAIDYHYDATTNRFC